MRSFNALLYVVGTLDWLETSSANFKVFCARFKSDAYAKSNLNGYNFSPAFFAS